MSLCLNYVPLINWPLVKPSLAVVARFSHICGWIVRQSKVLTFLLCNKRLKQNASTKSSLVWNPRDQFWSSLNLIDHELRTLRERFFSENHKLWARAAKLVFNFLGHLGYFLLDYQHPLWYCGCLVHVFHQSAIISTKNVYIQIPKIYWRVGVEFGPERIGNLVIVCR